MVEHREKWKTCKKKSDQLCKIFLQDCTAMMAEKLKTTEEKALKAVLSAETSCRSYATFKSIMEKQQSSLTQVDVPSSEQNPAHPHTTLTKKKILNNHLFNGIRNIPDRP
jgi:thymidine phosphorylase